MKKIFNILIILIIGLSLTACQNSVNPEDEQARFKEFIDEKIEETLESDFTSLTYLLNDPEAYGIDMNEVEINWGERLDSEDIFDIEDIKEDNEMINSFNRNLLTPIQQAEYEAYKFTSDLNLKLSQEKFQYYDQVFSSMNGLHYGMATYLSDYKINDENDINYLITLIKDSDEYITSAINYAKVQLDKGYLMIDVDTVGNYIDGIIDNKDNSSILHTLFTRIDDLKLDITTSNNYKDQLEEAFLNDFIDAYELMSDFVDEAQDSGKINNEGYASLPDGKEYYELTLKSKIGKNISVSDAKKYLDQKKNYYFNKIIKIASNNPELLENFNTEISLPYTSYEEIIEDVYSKFTNDFPELEDISYSISNVSDELASNGGVSAYYIIPAIDEVKNTIKVNPYNQIGTLETFKTVCHEGIPGHMYQFNYFHQNVDSIYLNKFSDNLGFTEGYAVYVENYINKYLDVDPNILELADINEILTYIYIMESDIGIHYDGWDFKKFEAFMNENFGENSWQEQYNQLWSNPAAFEAYYYGYMTIDDLATKAKNQLGDKFNHKEFIRALNSLGTAPFNTLDKAIEQYISDNK